jgi:hypothetical protein
MVNFESAQPSQSDQFSVGVNKRDPIFKVKLMNCSARLMETYRKGALALQRLQSGASQVVQVQHVQING